MGERLLTIGLIGGIGSGKSLVAELFRKAGAEVIDADRIAHDVLQSPRIVARIRKMWGPGVLGEGGTIDRKKLAERAFRSRESIEMLNRLIHPRVIKQIRRRLSGCRKRMAVIDAPLLLEAGQQSLCDALVFVDAPRTLRIRRIRRRGWDAHELLRRERRQLPLKEKRKRADYIVKNNGTVRETFDQVKRIVRELMR